MREGDELVSVAVGHIHLSSALSMIGEVDRKLRDNAMCYYASGSNVLISTARE
jgi:hypothetical protein